MRALLSFIFDLIGNLFPSRGLWTTLGIAIMLLAVTFVGITGRVVAWLETNLFRG